MSKKSFKTTKALALTFASTMIFVACNETGKGKVEYASLSDVEFWGAYSSEKVLQDNVTAYDDIKKAAVVNVSAVRGEEEATQIIMTAGEKPVEKYNVTLSDLTEVTTGSDLKFSKENIKVYHERYIYVGQGSEYYTLSGYYPDCLVPFENVKQVGETGFKSNNNQGLYVSFDVPEDQAAGTYTGSIAIEIGGETKTLPVTLEVVNASIGVETHVMSSFLNEWYFYRGELDTTEEMYDAYNKFLFDYRLGCNDVVVYSEDVDFYAEKVCEYAKLPECPGYNIPWYSKNYQGSGYELNGRVLDFKHSYDVDKLQLYLKTIAYKGLEENVDPFKKAFIYGWDEPDLGFGVANAKIAVKEWSYIVKQCKIIVAEELRADESIENQELLEEMLASLEGVPHLVLSSTFLDNDLDLEVEDAVYGPEFQHLESQGARDLYRLSEDNDLWWYGCVEPDYPYPTYHIDDTVLSARLESWMKADYNIQGNLYWSTCLYSEPSQQAEAMVYPEDFYSGNAARSLATNGEGFVLYPGAKYGIYGPLPSLRLEQIRDGLEEYEMIYELSKIYEGIGSTIGETFNEDAIMRYLYDSMYSGTKVSTTSANFEFNRALLLDLFEMAASKANVCIMSAAESTTGYTFEVYANEGYELKQAGSAVTEKRAVTGGSVYTMNVALGEGGKLDLSVAVDGKTYGFALGLGSSVENYNANYAYTNGIISKRNISVGTSLATPTGLSEQYVRLSLGNATTSAQDFLIKDKVIKNLSAVDNKLLIRLYNDSDTEVKAEMLLEYGQKLGSYNTYSTITLKPGMNTLSLNNLEGFNWTKRKYINSIRIIVGAKGDTARDFIYFVDMSVYKK